ncbi:hypothetical protein [Lachnoclostridium sp. Marseille-P6806]|uniref:hypothetical protein n=1 Tax=Lachnoclostridium sp. Marseille-P6806 TaxID=2364793 RepID=UPI0010316717|nr:hypothetical protein [Lachnoclostridium sp. Marseille-P6806]
MNERTMKNIFARTLTETQKNALFAFGEKGKAATGCNLMIAASMCEGELTKAILLHLADLIETIGITEEEFEDLLYKIRLEMQEKIMNMERETVNRTGNVSGTSAWRTYARKKFLAIFGNENCGATVRRLAYVEQVTVDPDLRVIVHELASDVAHMGIFKSEKYPELLADARKVDGLWKIRIDDLGYFTGKG